MDMHTCVFMYACDASSCVHVLNACDTCSQYALFIVRACADAIHMHACDACVSTNVMCVLMYVMYVMHVRACDTYMFVQ